MGASASWRRPALASWGAAWGRLVEALAAIGTILICVLMAIICADIVFRNGMGSSLPLVSELGALLLVMIVSLQLAATVRADRLARTEIFLVPFRRRFPRSGALLSALFNIAGAAIVGSIAWATVHILGKDLDSGEYIGVTGIATMPTWPFRVLILVGMSVAALEFAFQAVTDFRRAVSGGGQA